MTNVRQSRNLICGLSLGAATAALAIASMLIVVAAQPAQAQTYTVIHTFTGGQDGGTPRSGLTIKAGNLYGTAYNGGVGYGTVYQLKHKGAGWTFTPLYTFKGFGNGGDGANPEARVIFGPNGTLYGTTNLGGLGVGTVFNLRPAARACTAALCPWTETVLHSFYGNPDGEGPGYGDLIFDKAGNIYGTTSNGGNGSNDGTVYELTPKAGGGYTEMPIYSFSGSDGAFPQNGVIFDNAGNLYSTTINGGLSISYGTVFELTKSIGWTESLPYSFQGGNDGGYPYAGLIFDPSGNLYGATSDFGTGGGGTVFELSPSGDSWTYNVLYSFAGTADHQCGPWGTLVMDGAGNLYGTTYCDGANGYGNVFELSPLNGGWIYMDLYDFTGGNDGGNPVSNVVFDASGNLYGTASTGGTHNVGVVWEITFP